MKNLILLMLLGLSSVAFSQEKEEEYKPWRTLTVSNMTASTFEGETLNLTSANISYELNRKYSVQSWTGFNYNFKQNSGWISSQTTINRSLKHFILGVGVMYNSGFVNVIQEPSGKTFGVVTISKRFKL